MSRRFIIIVAVSALILGLAGSALAFKVMGDVQHGQAPGHAVGQSLESTGQATQSAAQAASQAIANTGNNFMKSSDCCGLLQQLSQAMDQDPALAEALQRNGINPMRIKLSTRVFPQGSLENLAQQIQDLQQQFNDPVLEQTLQAAQLQNMLEKQQQMMNLLSNVMKKQQEASEAIIQNMR